MKKKMIILMFISFGLIGSDKEGTVSEKEGLKIREKADKSSKQTGFIPFQEKVTIIDENGPAETLYGIKSTWMKIKYKNITGWAFGGFIDKGGKWEKCAPYDDDCTGLRRRDMNFDYTGKKFSRGQGCNGFPNPVTAFAYLTLSPGKKEISISRGDGRSHEHAPECGEESKKIFETGTYSVKSDSLEIRRTKRTTDVSYSYSSDLGIKKEEWKKKCKSQKETAALDEKEVLIPYECKKKDGKIFNVFKIQGEEGFFYGVPEN